MHEITGPEAFVVFERAGKVVLAFEADIKRHIADERVRVFQQQALGLLDAYVGEVFRGRYAVLAPEEHAHIAGNVAKHAAQRLVGDVLGVVFAQVMLCLLYTSRCV